MVRRAYAASLACLIFIFLIFLGGARRNRTDDLFNAIEALSQLSYGPILFTRLLGEASSDALSTGAV
jgi:hypothetical protein